MSDRINDFLDKICASVKYRTMHSEIREEFKNHIDEAVFEFEKFSHFRGSLGLGYCLTQNRP